MARRSGLLFLIATLGILFPLFFTSAQTSDATLDLRALIRDLQSQIQALQAQVKALKQELGGSPEAPALPSVESAPVQAATPEAAPPELTRSLTRGTSGDDVRKLQEFLATDKEVYPDGLITGFFGPLTEVAVKKWQKKHGIEALGIVGPQTRAKLQDIGRGVIQGLITQGAGASGVVPPGLLRAPGIQKKLGTTTTPPPAGGSATTTPVAVPPKIPTATTTISITATTTSAATATSTATTTSAVATQATPTTPAIFASPTQASTGASAVPATTAVLATTTTTTASSTATTTATTAAPIFTISSPNGGEQMTVGNTYTITWTSAGTNVSVVNIDLYKSGSYSASIAYDASNNGSMSWTVPATMAAGTDYKIRVYHIMYSNNFDESNSTFTIVVPVSAPAAPPIGYWKFDGNGTNEIAGNPSAVTVGGAAFKSSGGKFGGYLYMPTNNDYAKIPYHSMFDLQNFTVELWFRQRSNQSFNQNLIYKGTPLNNYNFNVFRNLWNQYNNGPVIAGSTAAGTGYWHQVSNNNEPPHNLWHHVVYTKTTEGAAYYIDGVLIHSRNYAADRSPEYAGPVKTPAVDIIIGNPAPDTDIDNLRIYNYALSRGEVLYNLENIPGVVNASDTTPPTISSTGSTNVTATSASITWITNEAADSQVEYGLTANYGSTTVLDASLATAHSVSLSQLASNSTYYFRIKSKDAAGNLAIGTGSFATTNPPDTVGPLITSLSITPTNGNAGQIITFTVTAEDPSGVGNIVYDIKYPNSSYYLRPNCNVNGATSGTCTFSQAIDQAQQPTLYGSYVIETIRAADSLGNVATYYPTGSVTNGSQSSHSVTIPAIVISAPTPSDPTMRVTSSSSYGRGWPRISGNTIVWQENGNIFSYDISSGAQKQITSSASNEYMPYVSGNRIVYGFYEGNSSGIKMYDLNANTEKIVIQGASSRSFSEPAIDGDNVVYEADNGIYLYNLATGIEKKLASSSYNPAISGDDVVWEHQTDYVIWHYKISTGVTRSISPTNRISPQISNGTVVYHAYYGSGGLWDVFTYNLASNTETKRTSIKEMSSSSGVTFSISGSKFVWDQGYTTSSVNYVYDINTGVKTAFASASSYKSPPWISGNIAVWMDSKYSGAQTQDLLYVDLSQVVADSGSRIKSQEQDLAFVLKSLSSLLKKLQGALR